MHSNIFALAYHIAHLQNAWETSTVAVAINFVITLSVARILKADLPQQITEKQICSFYLSANLQIYNSSFLYSHAYIYMVTINHSWILVRIWFF